MIEKTKAFIINRRVYRDTSLLLTLYSYDFGKIEGIVKGVRKIEDYGRYDGVLDLFSNYEVVFYPRKSKFALFVQFYLLNSYWESIRDYSKFSTLCSAIELLNYVMQPYEDNKDVYGLIDFLLSEISANRTDIVFYTFLIKLLKFSGFSPQINECINCAEKIEYKGYLSISEGALYCSECGSKRRGLTPVSSGVIKSINFLKDESYVNIKRFLFTPKVRIDLENIIAKFLKYHISFSSKSWSELNSEPACR
ncbi:MAG: DNA repair protein RecO [Candidatus Kaelpia imicola]|nr:DNA repair protein RecO [Candidatus Kaelpia imicola]